MFLATVTMLFAAFTSAYIVRRSGSRLASRRAAADPLAQHRCPAPRAASPLEAANRHGLRRRWRAVDRCASRRRSPSASRFSPARSPRGGRLVAAGVYLPSSPHSSFFYMLTGAHARARRRGAGRADLGRCARRGAGVGDPRGVGRADGALPDVLALPRRRLGVPVRARFAVLQV